MTGQLQWVETLVISLELFISQLKTCLYANSCTFISYLISYLSALEKIFNLQIYVCGMLKHFLKLCSKKPQKSSPEFSRLCGRPPLPSRGGGQHATVTRECVRQCVRLPSRAWCHQDSTHWLPSSCTSHSPPAPYRESWK